MSDRPSTLVDNSQKYRLQYWATRSSVRSFARTAHSFACSGLLASLAPSAALTRSLARSLRSLPCSWGSEFLMSQNDLVLSHSAAAFGPDLGSLRSSLRSLDGRTTFPILHRSSIPSDSLWGRSPKKGNNKDHGGLQCYDMMLLTYMIIQ